MTFDPFNALDAFGGGAAQSIAERYRAAVMADFPVAYWRLGEASGTTAADETGNQNGAYVGSPSLGVAGIFTGNAAVGFANGKYATIAHNATLKPAFPITLEAWIRPTSFSAFQMILSNDDFGGAAPYQGACLQLNTAGNVTSNVGNGVSNATNGRKSFVATSTVTLNAWNHLVAVWSSVSSCAIYINGAATGTTTSGSAATMVYSNKNGTIGASYIASQPVLGSLDELAIYPTALSAARIAAHYAAAGY